MAQDRSEKVKSLLQRIREANPELAPEIDAYLETVAKEAEKKRA